MQHAACTQLLYNLPLIIKDTSLFCTTARNNNFVIVLFGKVTQGHYKWGCSSHRTCLTSYQLFVVTMSPPCTVSQVHTTHYRVYYVILRSLPVSTITFELQTVCAVQFVSVNVNVIRPMGDLYTHNRKASNALCTLVGVKWETRNESFSSPGENCQRNVTDLAGSLITSSRPPSQTMMGWDTSHCEVAVYELPVEILKAAFNFLMPVSTQKRSALEATENASTENASTNL